MKNGMIIGCSLIILVYITGCATMSPQQLAAVKETVPHCYGETDCEAKWAAARKWVLRNSSRKIQIYSDDLIETYNPEPYSPRIAVRVVKKSLRRDEYAILATVRCSSIFGCIPTKTEARQDFNNYVNSAVTEESGAFKAWLKEKKYNRPKLGVGVFFLNKKLIVKKVWGGSPAEKAGIKCQDIINRFDEQSITSMQQFLDLEGNVNFGEEVKLEVRRADNAIPLIVEFPSREELQE